MFAKWMSWVRGSNSVPHTTHRRILFGRGEFEAKGLWRFSMGAAADPHFGQGEF
jgi:hypothetical protein